MGKARSRSAKEVTGVTLDAGALIALERGDRRVIALLQELVSVGGKAHVPAGVVGEVWRGGGRQVTLSRFLASREVEVFALDLPWARACGELCALAGCADVIDASVVLVARQHGEAIVTSDVNDLRRLDPSARLERI
jgi:predicted nucleic acid-binding protein